MNKDIEILLQAMKQGFIYYPIDDPDDCYAYDIECLYYNKYQDKFYLYVADGVGEVYAEGFNVTWSLTK